MIEANVVEIVTTVSSSSLEHEVLQNEEIMQDEERINDVDNKGSRKRRCDPIN